MIQRLPEWFKRPMFAGFALVLLLIAAGAARGQGLRGPDLGVWFRNERGANGTNELIVADLIDDGVFAAAGLREGDRIVSVNGKAIDRESEFVHAVMAMVAGNHKINLALIRKEQQNEHHQTLALNGSTVRDGIVAADLLYEAGLIVDDRNPAYLVVQRVFPLTPSFYAGVRQGDVIKRVGGQPIASLADFKQALRRVGKFSVVVTRNDETRQLTISIGTERSDAMSALRALRRSTTGDTFPPATVQPPPPIVPYRGLSSPPLLAPTTIPSNPPVVPTAPPPIPSLPPPGTVPSVPHIH